jgi:hypothetical protein
LSYQSCGHCPQCLRAHGAYCSQALAANFSGARFDGFASILLVSSVLQRGRLTSEMAASGREATVGKCVHADGGGEPIGPVSYRAAGTFWGGHEWNSSGGRRGWGGGRTATIAPLR